jgi:hypothetical protein
MRPLTLFVILPVVLTVGAAQNSSVVNRGPVGVFTQADGKTPQYKTLPDKMVATTVDPLSIRVELTESRTTIAHARTKLSLRLIDGMPAIRVYEAGWISKVPTARQRAVATTSTAASAGSSVRPHTWLARFTGNPGDRVRVHIRLRSQIVGKNTGSPTPTNIRGYAKVDVGDDKVIEFQKDLDAKRYLSDHIVPLGASGRVDIKIETGVLLTSTAKTAASYAMTFDISIEPIRGIISSMAPYGPLCGPDVYGITWADGSKRYVRTILENAIPSSPTLLIVGAGRLNLPLPGMTCNLLTVPLALVPAKTTAAGRIISDFPSFPASLMVDVNFQYAVSNSGSLHMSKGMGFRVFLDSPEPYEHFDINHVLSTGQSLAIGGLGAPVLSKKQNYENLMFGKGLLGYGTGKQNQLSPLVEQFWETMSSGLSSIASQLYITPYNNSGSSPKNKHNLLVSVHAQPGLPYALLKKGTQPFSTGMNQFRLAQLIAATQNKSHVIRCVTCVHGETDHTFYNSNYAKDLIEWQADYEAEIQTRGQTEPVPMLHSQMSSFTSYQSKTSVIPGQQLAVSVTNPRKLPLVMPKYFLEYRDGVHLTSEAYRQMGEYYGKVYNHVILEGATWEPLRPVRLSRTGAVISVRFHVPEPPLVLDTTLVSDPGDYGFEYADNSGSQPTIKSVRLVDEDTVEITLSSVPKTGAISVLTYAFYGKSGAPAGPRTGARGCLRDSDLTPSRNNSPLFNWAVHFGYLVR